MTRRTFITDIATAVEWCNSSGTTSVSRISKGSEDGEIHFCYSSISAEDITIHVIATGMLAMASCLLGAFRSANSDLDVDGYPRDNRFLLYTHSQVPKAVEDALGRMTDLSSGLRLTDLISQTASELEKALADGSRSNPLHVEDEESVEDTHIASDEEGSDAETSNFGWLESSVDDLTASSNNAFMKISPEAAAKLNKQIREDIRSLSNAGFKFGVLAGMKANCKSSILSISRRVARLGLSDEAISAWQLQKQQYIVLLIQYTAGYKTFDAIINDISRSHGLEFRIGVSNRYKPTINEAVASFTTISKTRRNQPKQTLITDDVDEGSSGFSDLFISSSLNEFMKGKFTSLLTIRHRRGIDWDEANRYLRDSQIGLDSDSIDTDYSTGSAALQAHPGLVTADHIVDSKNGNYSVPLMAMEFALHHLTRCTEYCLVCHDKTGSDFGALKPYVCSKPLCLYQVRNIFYQQFKSLQTCYSICQLVSGPASNMRS